ncbi:energy transducer TonB [Mucilaginibacter sp.]|uniref:energy transducer TonB n=1 Tax=Mucilaginibacter sp. TaxID=1882438 RepID=UPI00284A42EC|nr:energy transducer TonB [Mucilaginibacter sp.]MDR3695040.1 energy transducer TonB [Mucilaginibacter sp.]
MKWIYLTLIYSLLIAEASAQNKFSKQPNSQDRIEGIAAFDQMPAFPSGKESWGKFLSHNLKWPSDPMDDTYGRVIVSFMVEKDGSLSDYKVEKSLGTKFDTEALRVLKKSPKWIPGRLKGKPVRVRYSVPVNFTIS